MDPRLQKIMKLPNRQKVSLLVAVVVLLGAGFFFGLQQPKMKQLAELEKKQADLEAKVAESRRIADNLPKFKQEYADLEMELEKALTELPNQKEIPALLTSITTMGKNAGLDFLLFRPKPEVPQEFYSSVPVDISVSGTFQSVGNFFIAVGNLPRIVNIGNVNFSEVKGEKGKSSLKVTCLATTFRFLDKKEIQNDKKGTDKKGK